MLYGGLSGISYYVKPICNGQSTSTLQFFVDDQCKSTPSNEVPTLNFAPGECVTIGYNGASYSMTAKCVSVVDGVPEEIQFAATGSQSPTTTTTTTTTTRVPAPSTTTPPATTAVETPPVAGPSSPPIGAIVGGVIGGLAAVALLAGFLWWRRTRTTSKSKAAEEARGFNHAMGGEGDSAGAKGKQELAATDLPVAEKASAAGKLTVASYAQAIPQEPPLNVEPLAWAKAAPGSSPIDTDQTVAGLLPAPIAQPKAMSQVTSSAQATASPDLGTEELTTSSHVNSSVGTGSTMAAATLPVAAAAATAYQPPLNASSGLKPPSSPVAKASRLLVPASDITYDSKQKLGEGTFGIVYVGTLRGSTKVAVKTIKGEVDDATMRAFDKEVANWEVLPLIAYCSDPPMMVTDLMRDGNLRKHMAARGWPLDLGLRFLLGVAEGMTYLHGLGILHGDIKSLNVLIDGTRALIADFGLSKVRQGIMSTAGTSAGGLSGTPGFLSPELLDGQPLRKPGDVYAFAMLCYEVVSGGKYPFEEMLNPAVILYNVAIKGARPVRPANVPDAVWSLIERCWDQDPLRRPEFAQIVSELEKIVGQRV
ncbi:kinase-like domain-containing protein [Hyaloraphidium curvatum]|nr:kinase-like domain-containing protein [Hyaloraphidium curvatum]